jgi:hypothetical protein
MKKEKEYFGLLEEKKRVSKRYSYVLTVFYILDIIYALVSIFISIYICNKIGIPEMNGILFFPSMFFFIIIGSDFQDYRKYMEEGERKKNKLDMMEYEKKFYTRSMAKCYELDYECCEEEYKNYKNNDFGKDVFDIIDKFNGNITYINIIIYVLGGYFKYKKNKKLSDPVKKFF